MVKITYDLVVKITHDLDNAEERKIVEDYYFFKYYTKSLIFDWAKFYDKMCENGEDKDVITKIIINHLNKYDLQRFLKITNRFMYDNSVNCILHQVLTDGNNFIGGYGYFKGLKCLDIENNINIDFEIKN